MDNKIFREKSIERVTSPDQLNDYIKVSTPGMWLLIAAIIILLAGAVAWSFFGLMEKTNPDGSSEMVHPITFVIN